MTKPIGKKNDFFAEDASGILVPDDLVEHMCDIADIKPNDWNPNHMDTFMREKLVNAIKKDGFILPIIVRPSPEEGAKWEIVDGEHRWLTARDELKMAQVPILNLGAISDAAAKEITIKANTLHGEFDSIELGKIVENLIEEQGMDEVADSLPYTPERLQGMVDLLQTDITDLEPAEEELEEGESSERSSSSSDFESFDPSETTFDHECPRCGFEFNAKKEEE
jgi:ParB/RepB/Spo0J family partition protein